MVHQQLLIMVVLKSSQAIGSFLGIGTHVWLEIQMPDGNKVTFSGARVGKSLGVIKNYKRDYNKQAYRGKIVIPPPAGLSQERWMELMVQAGDAVLERMHLQLLFSGVFPYVKGYGNCCTIAHEIVRSAGGLIPCAYIRGMTPGLKCSGKTARVMVSEEATVSL